MTQSTESTYSSVTSSRVPPLGNNQPNEPKIAFFAGASAIAKLSMQDSDSDVRAVIEDAEQTIQEEGNFQTMGDTTFRNKVYAPKGSNQPEDDLKPPAKGSTTNTIKKGGD